MAEEVFLSRRAVRHELVRRRNERIADTRDDRWPVAMFMHQDSLDELLIDSDPGGEVPLMDFEGKTFMGVPVITDSQLAHGEVRLQWPEKAAR